MLTSKERLKIVLAGDIPDCVPVCPDVSNMIPARRTGKPFWDVYLKQDPPLWKAYVDTVKYFGFDGMSPGGILVTFDEKERPAPKELIVDRRDDGSFFTQTFDETTGQWGSSVVYYTSDNPPACLKPEIVGLPKTPSTWEEPQGIKKWPSGYELWKLYREELGDSGVAGFSIGVGTLIVGDEEQVYQYYDDPAKFARLRDEALERLEIRMEKVASLEVKPDIIFFGGSGSLIWQTPQMFRELALPIVKKAAEMAHDLGIASHVHSCGPERELVRMAAEETLLTIIDPLEIPPRGDCDLKELKRLYGEKLVLKGNLHTTDVMLQGSTQDVAAASRYAIDAAAKGGRFVLSTGDQCGRDTPDENIFTLIETARSYGRY